MSSRFSTAELPASRVIPACDAAIARAHELRAEAREEFIVRNIFPEKKGWLWNTPAQTREDVEKFVDEPERIEGYWFINRRHQSLLLEWIGRTERLRDLAKAAMAHDPSALVRVTTEDWHRISPHYEVGHA